MRKIKQKKLLILLVILLVIAIRLGYKYSVNNSYISKYNDGEYSVETAKKLLFLNIQEKYIAHYNYGTSLYQTENYEKAKKEFSEALKSVPKKRVCDVRVNLALTEIKLLPEKDNVDTYIKNIESIQSVLLGNDCATKNHNGKDQKAQDLYDALEQLKEEMQQGQGQGEGEDDPNEGEEGGNEEEVIDDEQSKIEQIKDANKNASKGRNPSQERDYNTKSYKDAVW